MKIITLVATCLIVIVGIVYWTTNQKTQSSEDYSLIVYSSQIECENATGGKCIFQMCDYVPQGRTFEEVCGKNFKKGWVGTTMK